MSIMASLGAAVGIMVGAVICVLWFRYANTDTKIKTEYDERQQIIRNNGYRLAFYTMLTVQVVLILLAIGGFELPMVTYAQHFVGIMAGATALGVYCIWKEVYWGLNNNIMRYTALFIFTILLNCIPIVGAVKSNTLIVDGKIGMASLNIMVMIMLTVIVVTLLIKKFAGGSGKEEEE